MWVDSNDIETLPGDNVIVQTKQGLNLARVTIDKPLMKSVSGDMSNKVIRKATEEDLQKNEELKQKSKEAFTLCMDKIEEHKLVMKLVDVEFLLDDSKAIFYFTADGRVDFRELVKDLAHTFHTRIEMRQIGVRDEAKMVGGIGNCGREFCCASFLHSFEPVSVRMAKEQNLALNPMKISGACGRLMCCLAYEHGNYIEMKKRFPKCGRKIKLSDGEGKVVKIDTLNNKVFVQLDSGEEKSYDLEEIERFKEGK